MIGIIKTLMLKELVGYGSTDKAVYPVTSTGAVFDNNSVSLDSIIADLYTKIKNNTGGGGGGDNPDNPSGGGGTKGEKGDKGDPGETYNYVPCFIYISPKDNAVPKKPVGGSYDFSNNKLTPPSGWSISYAGMNKPIYMSIGMACSKAGSTIEWSAPFIAFSNGAGGGSDLPYEPVPESNYKTLFIYKHSDNQPDIPVGGSYDFETQRVVLPNGDWRLTKDTLEKPVYMSVGFCSKSKTDIEWSYPIIVADGDGLGPGKTPGSDILTKTYVVAAYITSNNKPTRPDSDDGYVNFTKDPYEITPPKGWSLDRSIAVNDNAWCTIKVFHQTSKNDYNNNSTPWSEPVQANLANVTLTDDQFQLIANQVKVDATDITTNFNKWIAQGSNIETIAKEIVAKTDIYEVVAGQYIVNADFIENVANKVISVANFKQDVIQDASGKAVVQITADKDGLYSAIANNIVQEAIADKDNKGGIIYLVAKDAANYITAEILAGTDENGKGFVKAIANNIDINSDNFKSIVANAVNGQVSAIMQDNDKIAMLIKNAAEEKVSGLIVGDQFINLIAPKVDVSGKLSSKDLTINGGASQFNRDGRGYVANGNFKWDENGNVSIHKDASQFKADGSGQVANGNISWDPDGNVSIKGKVVENTKQIELTLLNSSATAYNNNSSNIAFMDATDPYTFYTILNTRDKPNLLSLLYIQGHSLGATIKFTVTNYTEGNKVILCSPENKDFRFKTDSSSSYIEKTYDSTTSGISGIVLGDGFYELVAISNDKWMLTVGYGDSSVKTGMYFD